MGECRDVSVGLSKVPMKFAAIELVALSRTHVGAHAGVEVGAQCTARGVAGDSDVLVDGTAG